MAQELDILSTSIPADWVQVAPLDYLSTFVRQVPADQFFESLVENTRIDMINLQMHIKTVESAQRKAWSQELAGLKRENYEVNIDRITVLEGHLNEASEKYVADRLSNYVKHDTLNSEKMTPHFLRIAEKNVEVNMGVIRDEQGNIFAHQRDRDEYITSFYEKLYKNPARMPANFDNCVEEFLGDLINHPVIRGCKLTEDERMGLERTFTVEELDESLKSCNSNSAPGIDGLNNRFIKKFWNFFRVPLLDYANACVAKGKLTDNFRTALIRLIPKKGDTTQVKNWRPISLLSCFYKIISKAVNKRLDGVIDKLTSLNQKAYNEKRYIQEALICTINTVTYCEHNNVSGAILSIDQKKAFDSVYHGFMDCVYKFVGFEPNFIRILKTIGTGRKARVILESGKPSRELDLERGFAQGDGPSPRLYNIGEQILLFRIEYDPNVSGVYLSFVIPRVLVNNELTFQNLEVAVENGMKVDEELKHTNRKIPAFFFFFLPTTPMAG